MKQMVLSLFTGILIGALAGFFGMNGFKQQSSDELDAYFIEHMIPHHQDAVTMSELARNRAKKPEVKQLAEDIIQSQTKEIEQMKAWYKNWFGKDIDSKNSGHNMHESDVNQNAVLHMGMMGDERDLERLESNEDFDRAFIEHMIPHHQMAVVMAEMLKRSTQRSEMKQLAEDIVTVQNKEIQQMREWLTSWGY